MYRKYGQLIFLSLASCMIFAFSLYLGQIVPSAFAQAQKTYKLVFHWETSAGRQNIVNWPYRPNGYFEWLVKKHTRGQVIFDVKERLHGPSESVLAVGDGRVDIGNQVIPYSSGTYPLFDFGALPGFFSVGPQGALEWAAALLDPEIKKIFSKYSRRANFIFLGANTSTAQQTVWANKIIAKVEDFKGVKVRTSGLVQTMAISELGGSPLTLATGEIFEALRRGTVDGIVTSLAFGAEIGLMDLCKYANTWPITPIFGSMVVINARKFDSLPKEIREGLEKAGEELTRAAPAMVENLYYTYPRWVESVKKTEIVVPDIREVKRAATSWEPVIKKWLETTGPEGKEVLRIAAKYAEGPAKEVVLKLVGK